MATRTSWSWPRRRDAVPRLSVIVPVYNVEPFIEDCLRSLRGQTYDDFEAVIVVDGSTDGSEDVVRRHGAADPRIRVVDQANSGLSAARNNGVVHSRGDFLTFLDADDTLPPNAYSSLMETIERTGSDMVIGTLKRDTGGRQRAMRLMERNHRVRRERVSLTDMPLMLADVFAVNKVYRRSFWDRAGLEFPTGMRYEDQPALTHAFLACDRFDVLPETVYLWRVREDRSSITQNRHRLEDLRDRVESKRISTAEVVASGIPQVVDTWFRDILPVDMWEYFRAAARASDDYWSTLQAAVREFWHAGTVPFERTRVPVQQRMMGWLVAHGRRTELADLIEFLDEHRGSLPRQQRENSTIALLPGVDGTIPDLPEETYVFGDHEL